MDAEALDETQTDEPAPQEAAPAAPPPAPQTPDAQWQRGSPDYNQAAKSIFGSLPTDPTDVPFATHPDVPPPWEQVADQFKKAFPSLDPTKVQKQYDQARRMASAHVEAAVGEGAAEFAAKSLNPIEGLNRSLENIDYQQARKRFDAGNAGPDDYATIAQWERDRRVEAQHSNTQQVIGAGLSLPGLALQYSALGLGGIATLQAFEAATGKAAANPEGGEFYEPHNMVPAAAMAGATAAVLGSLGKFTGPIKNAVLRYAASVGIGVGEWEAVKNAGAALDEVLPEAWKTQTDYGALGHLAQGKRGEALKDAIVETMTVAAFTALGGNRYNPKKLVNELSGMAKESLNDSAKQGASEEKAAENLRGKMASTAEEVLGVKPGASQDEIRTAYRQRARETHPDAGGSADEFQKVKWAYDQLTANARRKAAAEAKQAADAARAQARNRPPPQEPPYEPHPSQAQEAPQQPRGAPPAPEAQKPAEPTPQPGMRDNADLEAAFGAPTQPTAPVAPGNGTRSNPNLDAAMGMPSANGEAPKSPLPPGVPPSTVPPEAIGSRIGRNGVQVDEKQQEAGARLAALRTNHEQAVANMNEAETRRQAAIRNGRRNDAAQFEQERDNWSKHIEHLG